MQRESSGFRATAKKQGSRTYLTGLPCRHGHVAERYASTGQCVECVKSSTRASSQNGYFRRLYEAKKPEILGRQRERNRVNAEKRRAETRAWQSANPEKVRAYKRKNKHKRRAAEGVFTEGDVRSLFRIQRGKCVGCGSCLVPGFHVDHIIPLARGGTNWCGNLQLLCGPCNQRKSDRLPVVWRRLEAA